MDLGVDNKDLGTDNKDLGVDNKDLGADNKDLGTDNKDLGTDNKDLGVRERRSKNVPSKRGWEAVEYCCHTSRILPGCSRH